MTQTTAFYADKGGAGTTTIAAARAVSLAMANSETLLLDLAGDCSSALGMSPLEDGQDIEIRPKLRLMYCARLPEPVVIQSVMDRFENVIVDAGTRPYDRDPTLTSWLDSLPPPGLVLVTRACYLALRWTIQSPLTPRQCLLIQEAGRPLNAVDVQGVVGVPVRSIPTDPAVARAVDAGVLATRIPRSLTRSEALNA